MYNCRKTKSILPSAFYNAWQNMKSRCNNTNQDNYKYYGGRGISYDSKWESIEGFCEDMLESWEEGLTLDREDFNGNYNKENCRWITHVEQCNNRSSNRYIEINGVSKQLRDWSREFNIAESTIWFRYERGLKDDELLLKNPKKVSSKQSGHKGILWNKKEDRWTVNVNEDGKKKRIGSFDENQLSEAIALMNEYRNGGVYHV